jgi:hypothetical protein
MPARISENTGLDTMRVAGGGMSFLRGECQNKAGAHTLPYGAPLLG